MLYQLSYIGAAGYIDKPAPAVNTSQLGFAPEKEMLNGIIEIIVYCNDMHAQVEFYRDVLGLTVSYPSDQSDYSNEYWVTFKTGACTLALHGGAEGRQGEDAAKFVFGTADLDDWRAKLGSAGIRVSPIREPAPGVRVFDGGDPEGNVFSVESRD